MTKLKDALFDGLFRFDREAWMRFFIAVGGLTFAFLSATFSTVLRENGSFTGAWVAASFALVLAAVVGLTTVPYLAKRVAVHRMRDVLEYDVTREGLGYILLTLILGIAALNTSNNLLYIIVSAMMAAIIVSGITSAAMLRRLQLEVSLPEYTFARRSTIARFSLKNPRWGLPAVSIRIVATKQKPPKGKLRWQRGRFKFPAQAPPGEAWFDLPYLQLRPVALATVIPPLFSQSIYFPFVAAQQTVNADAELKFPRRGLYRQDEFGIATRFPFSFLVKTRRVKLSREVLVYPSVEATDELFEVLPLIAGEMDSFVRGRGYELYRIRQYLPDDPARHLDWKSSAKTGALMLREFSREDERKLRIVFDNPPPGVVPAAKYEKGIELCASLAWHFSEAAAQLSFAGQGLAITNDLHDFLRHLSTIAPAAGEADFIERLPASDDYNLVVTARSRGSIPTSLWAKSYFLYLGD